MNQKHLFTRSVLALTVTIISSHANAAGFLLNEYSAAALGRAFAGEGAITDNASVGSRNPAAMMMFERPSMSIGAIYIDPRVDIHGNSPITGKNTSEKDIATSAVIPNVHFIFPINEKWATGASITSNFGLATDFSQYNPAGPIAGKTDLKTANFNASGAYRLNEQFSFGLGSNALYADAEITRHAGEFGSIVGMPTNTTLAKLKGAAWGYGWNAGLLYELDKENRVSLAYRSKISAKFNDGDYSSDLPAAFGGGKTKGKLDLHLPEIWEISGYHKVAPQWAMHYSFAYTRWSSFKELRATEKGSGKTLFDKHEGFDNAYRIALGATYFYDNHWAFRTGIAFDDSPVSGNNRSISIPDQDRFWASAGTTYSFNDNISVDVGISYMHGKKVNIKEEMPQNLKIAAKSRGIDLPDYEFKSNGKAWLYGVNVNYRF